MTERDTIFALSSGGLPSGVAVIRVSGPASLDVCHELAGSIPRDRVATLKTIRSRDGLSIDQALILVFRAPRSFTGEDCVEFQVHGGKAVVRALLAAISEYPGCRMAEGGEFSRRAFENGKLDLVEIEGLSDLITAETEMQRRLALEQSGGHLSELYSAWRAQLIRSRALIEAELDFSDEGDIPGSVSDQIWDELKGLRAEIALHLGQFRVGEIIRDGFKVAIIGPPNAGKSSLLNALARRDVAIVTEHAGTTRDIIQCDLDIDGYAVQLYDTAGLRETADAIELEGIRRATSLLEQCNLILSLSEIGQRPMDAADLNISVPLLSVGTKSDAHAAASESCSYDVIISTMNSSGLDTLLDALRRAIVADVGHELGMLPARLRQAEHVRDVYASVDQALSGEEFALEVRAEYLRSAGDAIGRLTGRIDVETLLGSIFSEFCVGK